MIQADTRAVIAPLLNSTPADALASYFALEHDPKRTRLVLRRDARGRACAFVAVCQTGMDLFRPLVVLRGDDSAALQDALREALEPGRQYLFSAPTTARPDLEAVAHLHDANVQEIYALRSADFRPVVNVLVQTSRTPDGQWRASIRARDGSLAAEAGTSWISSRYAEVFVHVAEALRRRGLGKSVVSAVSAQVLSMQRTPLYVTDLDNVASRRLALRLGYHDTGGRELSGSCSRK